MLKHIWWSRAWQYFNTETNPFENQLFYIIQGPKKWILNCPSVHTFDNTSFCNYRVEKQNLQAAKLVNFEHVNENMAQNSSPACKHSLFALIRGKKLFVKCLGI